MCARTHLVVLHDGSGLSLGGHIQLSAVPSVPPLGGAGNICLAGLSIRTVRLCALLSPPGLSILRSSVCFSLLLASHKRPPEGTATITRNTKAVKRRAGVDNDDKRARARVPPFPLRFLFCLLSSLPLDDFLRHAVPSA